MNVSLHSKLKHKIMAYYFSSGWRNVFKSDNFYSLYYADLFSGDGSCECDELDEELERYLPEDLSKRRWKSPFFNLMKFADESNVKLKCIFNDKEESKVKSLIKRVKEEGFSDFIEFWDCKDANKIYEDVLNKIGKPNRPSLFFLDPTKHTQLNFSTIRGIADFKDEKTGRMPELIINFMVYSVLMAIKRMGIKRRSSGEEVRNIVTA